MTVLDGLDDMPTVDLRVTCPKAPLQIEGNISGVKVYYRDRHGAWTVSFSTDDTDPWSLEVPVFAYGESDYWYDPVKAYKRIIDAYEQFRLQLIALEESKEEQPVKFSWGGMMHKGKTVWVIGSDEKVTE